MSERIANLDLAKGFCISIVMLFHIRGIAAHEYLIGPLLFSSCMLPPFFFLAGVFFRDSIGFKAFLKKKVNTLLIPFAFFYLITSVAAPNFLHYVFGVHFETVVGWPSLWAFIWPGCYPNIPLWFLWCLFIMELLFFVISRAAMRWCPRHRSTTMLLVCVSLAIIGKAVELYFSIDIACFSKALQNLPFLCIGFLMKDFAKGIGRTINTESRSDHRRLFIILIASLVVASLMMIPCLYQSAGFNAVLTYPCGVAGSIFIIVLSAFIGYLPLFSYLGRYSIMVVLTHGIMVRAGYPFFTSLSLTVGSTGAVLMFWAVMALSYLAIIPLLRFTLPHVTAQKPLLT